MQSDGFLHNFAVLALCRGLARKSPVIKEFVGFV